MKKTIYNTIIKRLLDILISIIGIIILFPVFIIISLLILIIDKNNPLYIQKRTGLNGNNFNILKFQTYKYDEITKLGSFLRKTSIDELPQLFNVLIGEMSIVGPRPWIPDYYQRFNKEQKKRTTVRPGIVGLAQVNGRNRLNVFQKIEFDLEYVKKISFKLDLIIILKSFKVIISQEENGTSDVYIRNELMELER